MKSARFGVAVFTVGLAVALGAFAYLLDHVRATVRVLPGLGDAAVPERELPLAAPPSGDEEEGDGENGVAGDELEPAREEVAAEPADPAGLVVRVVDAEGKKVYFSDVLAYRGEELLRADHAGSGKATLIPFDGPGSLRVESHTFEIARLDVPDGHGSYEIAVPRLPKVAGVVRVGGVPRPDIWLFLADGSDGWLDSWIAYGLETAGLQERSGRIQQSTEDDGTFCYEWLHPDWSGVLSLVTKDYRFVNGARRIELARPEEGLVLDVEATRPEVEFRGRVVFAGRPVPGALWELTNSGRWNHCDEAGRFSVFLHESALEGSSLELSEAGLGMRRLELGGAGVPHDLGDVELLPARSVHFVVRTASGAPIAGARATPLGDEGQRLIAFASWQRSSTPTDASGRGELKSLEPGVDGLRIGARGYESQELPLPETPSEPLSIVLARSATFQITYRDRAGRVPQGLAVRIVSRAPPCTSPDGYESHDEALTIDRLMGWWARDGDAFVGEFLPLTPGRVFVDRLRAGVPFDLALVDQYGSVAAAAPGLVLAPEEWRRVDLRVETEPHRLLVSVSDTLGHPLAGARLEVRSAGLPETRMTILSTDRAGMVRTEPFYGDDLTVLVSRRGFESRALEHVTIPREGARLEVRLAHDWSSW